MALQTEQFRFFEKVGEKGKLTGELIQRGEQLFGTKLFKALDLARNRRIYAIRFLPSKRIVWAVLGDNHFYMIYPHLYCQCHSFHFSLHAQDTPYCKHLIAQALAEQLNLFSDEERPDEDLNDFLDDKLEIFKSDI